MLLGSTAARWTKAPAELRGPVIACCGFANSTGLPIVLLSSIAAADVLGFGEPWDPELQERNLLMLLSIYQIFYPMIQWTVGRWLLTSARGGEELQAPLSGANIEEGKVAALEEEAQSGSS